MVKKILWLLVFAAAVVLLPSSNSVAGTLNWGVSASSFHIAGGTPNGGPLLAQLKYSIAVDHSVGVKERYTVRNTYFITNNYTYSNDTYTSDTYYSSSSYTSSYSSSDTTTNVWIDASFEGGDKNELQVSANDRIYEKGSNPMDVKVNASFEGGDKNELQVINSITN